MKTEGLPKSRYLTPRSRLDVLHALEPYQFDHAFPVGKLGREALGTTYADGVPLGDLTYDLDVGILVLQVG